MPNFDQDASDLPDVDKDGNAITTSNPLTLEDILVRQIERSDPVLGIPSSGVLSQAADSPINWSLLGLYLRDIFLEEQIDAIEPVLPDASESEAGIAEIANQTEGRSGTNDNRIMTSERVLDQLRNGTGVGATTSRRGTVELATTSETVTGTDTTRGVTPAGAKALIEDLLT